MVRRVTPAQFRAMVQKAERDQRRAIDNYNRDLRKQNAAVKQAVANHNREVRNYNSQARAHNQMVENQRRRLQQEIRRLNSRPTSTTLVTVRASTQTFVQKYEAVEATLGGQSLSAEDRRFLNLASDEAANSAYLLNAFDGDGSPEDDLSEEQLRAPSLALELSPFGQDLVDRWAGALFALSPANPDAARHFCTSAREVVISMLDTSAPDADVLKSEPRCETTDRGTPTRRAKIAYLLRRRGPVPGELTELVNSELGHGQHAFSLSHIQ